jgi:hypothetical protein
MAPQEWRTVASFGRWTGGHLTVAACRLSSGGWAVAKSELPGGSRVIQYLLIEHDLSTLRAPVEQVPELIDGVRLFDQDPQERAAVHDLGNPRMVEYGGEVYLVGDSVLYRGMTGLDPPITWIAAAKPVDQPQVAGRVLPKGRVIGIGGDPRIVRCSGRFVVTTQVPQQNVSGAWGKTVRAYESADLQTWKPMAAPDSAMEFYGYELTVAKGKLTLVGIVDISRREDRPPSYQGPYVPPLALVVLTYDADKGAWQTASTQPDATLTRKSEVKLIPPEVTGGALKLIQRESNDRFTTATIAE